MRRSRGRKATVAGKVVKAVEVIGYILGSLMLMGVLTLCVARLFRADEREEAAPGPLVRSHALGEKKHRKAA
jgi:nitrate reductase gamma subunit